ncbi:THO complex subunit 2 [Musca domestica]|uniref:THO complex subunit 2 n=1 Tax=Musca domestica TaxID=7370 RepID=A0ABM3VKH2_MUSDO|nr:THO complex subunit 2 [Musca domestica]
MRRLRKPSAKGKSGEDSTTAASASSSDIHISNENTSQEDSATHGTTTKILENISPTTTSKTLVTTTPTKSSKSSRRNAMDTTNGGGGGSSGGSPTNSLISSDVFKHFEKSGKSEFLKYLKQHVRDNESPYMGAKSDFKFGVSSAIYDLLWQGVRCNLKKDTVLNTLGDVVPLHEDFPSLILDVVNVLDAETSLMTDGIQEERLMFCQILKDLEKVIPDKLIKERLEIDTLQEVGIVKNKVFYTKFIKIKTKLYYKQRRFNLFREESEGYAKLITELNQEFEDDVTSDSIMDIIKSLIGCFNLDPNRVLDIILESFESRPERWQLFIPLLRAYMPNGTIICEVLGYKFRYFADGKTPRSLFHVCSLLLKYGVIDLNDIYVWLSPTDCAITSEWEQDLADAKEFVRKMNVIVTNKDKEPAEPEPEKEYNLEKYLANQKFGLCEGLLKVGDWENALKIIKKLPEQCVVVHEPIARALAELIHISIDQLYRTKCFKISPAATLQKRRLADDSKLLQKIRAKDFSDLRSYVIPMVIALGPSLHYDTVLMYKLIRIMRTIIMDMGVDSQNLPPPNSESETLYNETMTIMDAAILPALSYLDCNCPIAEEIWTVLKYFPYHYRYALYARWKNDTYLLHPQLIRRRGKAQKHIKAIMKRVSKENVKPLGRQIGKLSHCAPGFLFDYILLQIQIYDNLIGPVVDSLKYLTFLSFDCLGYCLIEALTMADRDRFKHDGTSISLWLQSLASFCGAIFKKYNIELSGLLQYVANQLKSQKSLDLLILKEIVQKMAGVESAEEMTNEQLNAMCGGELLRGEAGYFSQVRNTKKSSQRLKDALANHDLAVTLCLLMAQQKHCVIYRETAQSHLKLVGKLYDQCQDTLVQFGTFLGSSYSVDEYVERLPSIIAMLQDYHINSDVAFFLARPMFTHQINQKYDQLRKADPNAKKLTNNQKLQKYLEATNLIMNPIVESVRPLHGLKVWEDISPQFFVTFWSLSMYDLQVPHDSYQKEINKLKQLSQMAADSKDSNASKNKKEQERYIALMDKLQDERKKQQEHVDKILQRLQQQKDNWFLSRSAKSAKNETITQFLQLCLFPRCTFTALDALYCAKFVHTIHNLKAANFSTLLCYDRIFCDITYSVTSCTENEATRYGRFLCAMLETVMRWHSDQATFNRECANYPGFVTKFRVSNQFSEANDHVGYENYRHVCHKWHYKITKAIVFCLDSKEYMQIRNALIILMRILPHYPVLAKLAQIIERKVEKVREEEKNKRPDLFVIASSYIGQLKTKAAQMIKESDFHQVTERQVRAETAQATATTTSSSTPAPTAASSATNTTPTSSAAATTTPPISAVINLTGNGSNTPSLPTETKQTSNGEIKSDKREKERSERPSKIIKLNSSSATSERERERERGERDTTSGRNITTVIDISNEPVMPTPIIISDRDNDRHSSTRSIKDSKKDERTRDRERDREQRDRERDRESHRSQILDDIIIDATSSSSSSRSKRDKRREERYRNESPVEIIETTPVPLSSSSKNDYDRNVGNDRDTRDRDYERNERARDRDLSSVSNESIGSMQQQQRRSQDVIEYEKDSKRRKVDASSSNSKKQNLDDHIEQSKKERGLKSKERKEKLTDEEKDARKERKLGRKRERLEETSTSEHKRRRDVQNGDDDLQQRERDKYHARDKSPHVRDTRERSHEKFERDRERERERERSSRDERNYGGGSSGGGGGGSGGGGGGGSSSSTNTKSTRSRIGY